MKHVSTDLLEAIWQLWFTRSITAEERPVVETCFALALDHGAEPPSAQATRIIASCGKPLADAVAAGILTFGPRHGNAAGAASEWIREYVKAADRPAFLESLLTSGKIPGIGHMVYEVDPRTIQIGEALKASIKQPVHFTAALEAAEWMSKRKGRPLPLNIDGAIGAVMADFDLPAVFADAIFLCARTFGLTHHAIEEMAQAKVYRRGGK